MKVIENTWVWSQDPTIVAFSVLLSSYENKKIISHYENTKIVNLESIEDGRENTLFSSTSTQTSPGEVNSLIYTNTRPQLFYAEMERADNSNPLNTLIKWPVKRSINKGEKK